MSILNDGLSKKCKARLLKLFNIREQTGVKEEPNTTLIDQSTIYSIKTLGDLQSQIVQNEQNLGSFLLQNNFLNLIKKNQG